MDRIYAFLILFLTVSCSGRGVKTIKHTDSDPIFFDYKIQGHEKDTNATVYIQFHAFGPNGPAFVPERPARVEFDGQTIPADSGKLEGPYYEIRKRLTPGKHSITYFAGDRQPYPNDFTYRTFRLRTPMPPVVYRGDITLNFQGLEKTALIRVTATDTSYATRDINEIDTAKDGVLVLKGDKLRNLSDGPITLILSKEIESPIQNDTRAGGRIVVSYELQREFELRTPLSPKSP